MIGCRPTVEFSWPRARCTGRRQKSNDLARAAVGCNDGFGGLAAVIRLLRVCAPPQHGTTRHNGRSAEPPAARDHAGTTGVRWNHTRHAITRSTTGAPHHGRSYHRSIPGTPHDRNRHHGRSRIAPDGHEKGVPTTLPQPPNGLPISRRKRAASDHLKKDPISRAQRSAATMGSAGWPPSCVCYEYAPHSGTESRGTTGVWWNHTRTGSRRHDGRSAESPARDHAGTTGVRWNHPLHVITRSTTGAPHHGRSNHACTTRFPHHGRSNHACTTRFPHHEHSYHASTTRTRTTGTGTTGVHESRSMDIK